MKPLGPKDFLQRATFPSVVFTSCADFTRFNRFVEKLREKVGAQAIERYQLAALATSSLTQIADSLATLSLFTQARVLVFQLAEKKQSLLPHLANCLSQVPTGTIALVKLIDRTIPADLREIRGAEQVVFDSLEGPALAEWLGREATRLGITQINTGALHTLAQVGGGDLDAAAQALEQVSLFADGAPITEQLVRKVVSVVPEQEEFALLDAIESGNITRIEHTIEQLFTQGSNAFVMLGMIARNQLNRVAVASGLRQRASEDVVKRQLNLTPWVYDRMKKSVSKLDPLSMNRIIKAIVTADARLKGTSLGPQPILSELLQSLCSAATIAKAPGGSARVRNPFESRDPSPLL